jgi:hypothetical protein
LPKAVAQLSSLRGNRDGALIRTGADMEAGEYLDVTLDMRSKNAQAGAKNAILKPQVSFKRAMQGFLWFSCFLCFFYYCVERR